MKTSHLLISADVLTDGRKSFFTKLLFGSLPDRAQALTVKIVQYSIFFTFCYLIPLIFSLKISGFADFVVYREAGLNLFMLSMFYFGAFIGANLIYDLTLDENFHLLTFPITIWDLVEYRIIEITQMTFKFCFYISLPLFLLVLTQSDYSTQLMISCLVIIQLMSFTFYFSGIVFILTGCAIVKRVKSDQIFLNFFLSSVALFIFVVRHIKQRYQNINDFFAELSSDAFYSYLMPSNAIFKFNGLESLQVNMKLFLVLIFNVTLIYLLVSIINTRLNKFYSEVHIVAKSGNVKKALSNKWTFSKLSSMLDILPVELSTIIAKDILLFIRKPHFILKILFSLLLFLWVAVSQIETNLVANVKLFVLYFLPSMVISRLFLQSIGNEKSNIYLIKQIYPSLNSYFYKRLLINLIGSIIFLIPLLFIFIVLNENLSSFNQIVFRAPLLLFEIVLTVFLVTGFSAFFADFDNSNMSTKYTCISPYGIAIYWFVGLLFPFGFYLLDVSISEGEINSGLLLLLILTFTIGIKITILFDFLGIRKLQNLI